MNVLTVSKKKVLLARIWLFVQGAIAGGIFYVILSFLAVFIEGLLRQRDELCRLEMMRLYQYPPIGSCVPDWIYALLGVISFGPGIIIWVLLWPAMSEMAVQVFSGLMLCVLSGIVFLISGRKRGIVIFTIIYTLIMSILTYFGLYLAFIG